MDRLQTMRSFALVAREGSFAAAGRAMGLSRANVTRHVADLEAHLGVRLLERTTRAVRLSPVGEAYLPRCLDAMAAVDDAAGFARGERERIGGRVRVSAPVSWGRATLPDVVSRLARDHPALELDVQLTDRRVDLVREGVDVAVRIGDVPKTLRAHPLGSAALHVVASSCYLAEHGTPAKPSDLRDHDCVLYALASEPAVWRLGKEVVRVRGRLLFDNGDLAMGAVEAGLGIALQPDFVTQSALDRGTAVRILPDHPASTLPIAALTQTDQPSQRVRAVLDALLA